MEHINFKIGQEVLFTDAFGVCVILSIKGKTATIFEKNTSIIYKKRLTSLKKYVRKEAYHGEQELCEPIYEHGQVVFSFLTNWAVNGSMVWDNFKKEIVNSKDLTV